jgi:hypothetical protein
MTSGGPGTGPVRLPADAETLRAFLDPPVPRLPEDIRLRIGQAIHDTYW